MARVRNKLVKRAENRLHQAAENVLDVTTPTPETEVVLEPIDHESVVECIRNLTAIMEEFDRERAEINARFAELQAAHSKLTKG